MFRGSVVLSSSRVVGHQSLSDLAPHPTRAETETALFEATLNEHCLYLNFSPYFVAVGDGLFNLIG